MTGPVDDYLRRLERTLPAMPVLRARVLAEVEDHLREAASREGEDEAVRRFGPVESLRGELMKRYVLVYARLAALAVAAAFLAVPLLGYPLVENTLPPAPWASADAIPASLAWKREVVVAFFGVAAVALVGALAARRHARLVGAATATALAALVVADGFAVALTLAWPGAPWWHVLLAPAHLLLVAPAVVLLKWARQDSNLGPDGYEPPALTA